MFKMEVPYDKRIMQISLEDKNLAGVLVGRQSDYVSDKSEKEIVEESLPKRERKYCLLILTRKQVSQLV